MSITFYLGDEVKQYKEKWEVITKFLKKSSQSQAFVHICDEVFKQAVEKKKAVNGGATND